MNWYLCVDGRVECAKFDENKHIQFSVKFTKHPSIRQQAHEDILNFASKLPSLTKYNWNKFAGHVVPAKVIPRLFNCSWAEFRSEALERNKNE